MMLKQILDDTRGSALVEYALTLSAFILLTVGLIQIGLLMWTQAGLQHTIAVAVWTRFCFHGIGIWHRQWDHTPSPLPRPYLCLAFSD
jgi:hypothetical protein